MKKTILIAFLIVSYNVFGQVGIGTVTPNVSSILDVSSTTRGLLTPRMTTAQRDAVLTPAEGLLIYNLDSNCFQYFNGSAWSECFITSSVIKSLVCPPSPTVSGYYVLGIAMNTYNTITVTVTTAISDSFEITTNTVNGYNFSAVGILSAGTQTVTLTASGAPINAGTDTFTISLTGTSGTCTINIPVTATLPTAKNCQELLLAGFTTDGVYTIDSDGTGPNAPYDCYCNQTDNGGGWTLVFNHNVTSGYWANDAQADSFNTTIPGIATGKYSILNKINELQTTAGTYEFRLHYPDQNITNHWLQTFDPRSGGSPSNPVPGYSAIAIGVAGPLWGGLENNNSSTYLDGSVNHTNWWYSIGSIGPYSGGGIPGPTPVVVQRVQLYIR